MKLLPIRSDEDLDPDPVMKVRAGRVSDLTSGRNAWHSTWIKRYSGESAFFTEAREAQRAAEPLRKQGTTFVVQEVPALVFRATSWSLVLLDWQHQNSFAGWAPFDADLAARWSTPELDIPPLPPLSSAPSMNEVRDRYERFEHHWCEQPDYNSVIVARLREADSVHSARADAPLRTWGSVPQKTLSFLGWNSMTGLDRSWNGVQQFLNAYRLVSDTETAQATGEAAAVSA